MSVPFSLVDAFAAAPFSGNQAGVIELTAPADPSWMQQLAAEFGWSETSYLVPNADGTWHLRWFTPAIEVALCGHATVAAAWHLQQRGHLADGRVTFTSASGELRATCTGDGVELDFPVTELAPAATDPSLPEALGCMPMTCRQAGEDLLVELPDADAVRACQPDFDLLGQLDARGFIITAAGDQPNLDVISRFFAPRAGIPEDPVTGSAHCALAAWWAPRLQRQELRCEQASARGGQVTATLTDHGRVLLGGQAQTIVNGTLAIAPEPAA